MSPEIQKLIYEAAVKAGDELKGKLPPHPFHPKGRNAHAHVFERLKSRLGKSYKECDDSEAPKILNMIEWYANNPC